MSQRYFVIIEASEGYVQICETSQEEYERLCETPIDDIDKVWPFAIFDKMITFHPVWKHFTLSAMKILVALIDGTSDGNTWYWFKKG